MAERHYPLPLGSCGWVNLEREQRTQEMEGPYSEPPLSNMLSLDSRRATRAARLISFYYVSSGTVDSEGSIRWRW